ncbi:uncharacterized protein [Elaeis guineensis]|uniref:uncharacterized protein isoform X5 n=1 Tax=Elaeis guineensis var. tenera TaxID=51953 RepID=UPI003C6D5672
MSSLELSASGLGRSTCEEIPPSYRSRIDSSFFAIVVVVAPLKSSTPFFISSISPSTLHKQLQAMVFFGVLASLQVLVLIAIAYIKKDNCAEDVENQLGEKTKAEKNPTPRQSYHEFVAFLQRHCPSQAEKSCGRKDNHPMVSQYHDDTGNNTLDQILQPDLSPATTGRGAREPDEDGSVTHGNLELYCPSQAEKSCGRKDNHPMVSQYHDDTGNNTLDQILRQPDLSAASTGRGAPEPDEDDIVTHGNLELDGQRESREEERRRETEAEERHREMKSASKFSYFSTGISVAGIISIFSGYLGDQTGHAHTVPLKICTFFMLATFVSGASMLLLILINLSSHISIIFFRSLKYTTLGFLTLSMCSVSILFLKMFAILAFVPTLFIVLISFIMAWYPCSHHRGNRVRSLPPLSEAV